MDRIVSRHILSGSLTSNSCSAALTCVFVLREEFAFLFQTFSRSDPLRQRFRGAEGESSPQSPPAGAFLLKKRKRGKRREEQFEFEAVQQCANLVELETC